MTSARPLVLFIHGARSSPLSFAFLRGALRGHDVQHVIYGHDRPIAGVVTDFADIVTAAGRPVYLVGHSLGGLIAVAVAQAAPEAVAKVATLASPLGGAGSAWLRLAAAIAAPRDYLYAAIHPHGELVSVVRARPLPCPVLSFVATEGGNPLAGEPNDGVVTIASQRALPGPVYVDATANHFEVLLDETVRDRLAGFLFPRRALAPSKPVPTERRRRA